MLRRSQPDYTPDGVLAEIARVVPFFQGAVWEKLGDNGKQWPVQEGCIGTEILHTDTFKQNDHAAESARGEVRRVEECQA